METEDTPLPAHKPAFLRRVRIRGYKSIAFCDVTLEPLTILVGRNASGKSNFLDALGFLRDVVKYGVREAVKEHGGADSILHKGSSTKLLVFEVECAFGFTSLAESPDHWIGQYRLDIAFNGGAPPAIQFEECVCKMRGDEPPARFSVRGGSLQVAGGKQNDGFRPHPDSDSTMLDSIWESPFDTMAHLLKFVNIHSFHPADIRLPQKPDLYQPLEADGRNLPAVIESTSERDPHSLGRIQRYLNAIVPDVHFLGAAPVGGYRILRFRRAADGEPTGPEFDASSMSDGTLRGLASLTAIFQNVHDGQVLSLVAIEEPETALHPAAIQALVSAFDAATLRTQILLTTHSPDLLDSESIAPANVRLVQMIDGQTTIGPIDEASVEIVKRNLDTLGGMERGDELGIDYHDLERQRALARDAEVLHR